MKCLIVSLYYKKDFNRFSSRSCFVYQLYLASFVYKAKCTISSLSPVSHVVSCQEDIKSSRGVTFTQLSIPSPGGATQYLMLQQGDSQTFSEILSQDSQTCCVTSRGRFEGLNGLLLLLFCSYFHLVYLAAPG